MELNAKKTKILSTTTTETQQVALITEYGAVDIVPKSSTHKYLGRAFSGDLRDRGSVALNNRSACAWMQYNNLKHVLENKHITLQLRFKLFQSVITSTILYSLETCPLTECLGEKLDVLQRKMMRKIIGWHFVAGDNWETAGRRMKNRLQMCTDQLGIKTWSAQVKERKQKVRAYLSDKNHLMYQAIRWYPPCCSDFE